MNIAILGYGKMGKEIEKIALERNHQVKLIIDVNNVNDFTNENLKKVDVAIDFSTPGAAYDNIIKCFEAGVPIVSGTTGWLDGFEKIVNICNRDNRTFFYASNFSIGVNILFKINSTLAAIMEKFDDYNVGIEETHHTQKLDKPSGTAISLGDEIIRQLSRKNRWELDNEPTKESLKIVSIRKNNIPGIHTVTYENAIDTIKIHHSAKSRKGFALGAVMAAEFINGKTGIFNMDDLLGI